MAKITVKWDSEYEEDLAFDILVDGNRVCGVYSNTLNDKDIYFNKVLDMLTNLSTPVGFELDAIWYDSKDYEYVDAKQEFRKSSRALLRKASRP
nr:hypothetical protein [uncultured Rhodopila sp.]